MVNSLQASGNRRFGLLQTGADRRADARFATVSPDGRLTRVMVTACRGIDLVPVRHVAAPFGRQVALVPCPCLCCRDGWTPNLGG
jgi:hypothetical protein